jgi:hypothetical protein
VLYEVDRLETLRSAAYLDRLNNPTLWTSKMMTHYRGMSRGLCSVERSYGLGVGHFALLLQFKPAPESDSALVQWLNEHVLPRLPSRRGLGSVHVLRSALAAAVTSEQRIRGVDSGVDWALIATGYEFEAVAELEESELGAAALQAHGGASVRSALYQAAYSLAADEIDA